MWNKTVHNFGEVGPKQPLKVVFEYTGTKKIKSVHASCGCTGAVNSGNNVTVNYETVKVPNHLKQIGQNTSEFSKTVTVKFDDDSKEVLTIKGTVIDKSK